MINNTDITLSEPVSVWVGKYEQARDNLNEIHRLIVVTKKDICDTTLDSFPLDCGWGLDDQQYGLTQTFWRGIIRQTGIRTVMAPSAIKELDDKLRPIDRWHRKTRGNVEIPPFTEKNIYDLLQNLRETIPKYFTDYSKEVFQWLYPHWNNWHKTNERNRFKIGKKVVIEWAVTTDKFSSYLNQEAQDSLNSLMNMLHILDGKPVDDPSQTSGSALSSLVRNGDQSEMKNEYLSLRWYKVGTIHIKFKRDDLVEELCRRASEAVLPEPARVL